MIEKTVKINCLCSGSNWCDAHSAVFHALDRAHSKHCTDAFESGSQAAKNYHRKSAKAISNFLLEVFNYHTME